MSSNSKGCQGYAECILQMLSFLLSCLHMYFTSVNDKIKNDCCAN